MATDTLAPTGGPRTGRSAMASGLQRYARRGRSRALALSLLFSTLAGGLPGLAAAAEWQLENVNVIDVTDGRVTPAQDVRVVDGRIAAIGPRGSLPEPDRDDETELTLIDGAGGYLIPGLAEMHAHVPPAGQGEQKTLDVLTLFLANGVTTIRGMLGEPAHLELRARLASGEVVGPRLITSGPSFNGSTVSSPVEGAARVREQAEAGYDFLKIHPGLTREEYVAIAQTARAVGIPIAGHVSYETGLATALEEGQDSIDHLDAYAEALVPPGDALHGQAPQFFGLNLADGMDAARIDGLARATAEAKVWQVPTQSLFETTTGPLGLDELEARPGMDMLGETLLGNWAGAVENIRGAMTPEQRQKFLTTRRALLAAMQREGVGILLGSDAPQIMNVPGYSVHQELAYYVNAGLSPLEALQTGTINVARYFGETDRGQVAPGMVADLVLLAANPLEDITNSTTIQGVALGGTWFPRPDLERQLDGVRERKL